MNFRSFAVIVLLLLSSNAFAGLTINSVTYNSNPIEIDTDIILDITVTGDGNGANSRWYSTGYSIDGATEVCVDTGNYQSTSAQTNTINLGALSTVGEYEIVYVAYKNGSCGNGDSNEYSTTLEVEETLNTSITLSPDTIYNTDAAKDDVVGTLTVTDAAGSTSVSLHSWDGGTTNGSCSAGASQNWIFSINANELSIGNASGSTLSPGDYTICVKTTDNDFRSNVTITVEENVAGVDTEITLSPSTIYDTAASLNAVIGSISVTDEVDSTAVVFQSWDGGTTNGSCSAGAEHNWVFSINANELSIGNASGSTLAAGEYTICVKTDDDEYRSNLTITVEENTDDLTTEITLSNSTIGGSDAVVGFEIGDLTVVDPDESSVVSLHSHDGNTDAGECAAGATDNWRFGITNNTLSIVNDSGASLPAADYTICVKTGDDFYRQNLTITVEDDEDFVPGECPSISSQVDEVIINEVNHTNKHNWVEFYIAPNETINFNDWILVAKGKGNIDDQHTICDSDSQSCEFSGGTNGAFVIYGETPESGAPTNFIQNEDFAIHNTLQELLLLDDNNKLIHYVRYANNQSSANFEYTDCPEEYTTEVLETGNSKSVCAETDGSLPSDDWSGTCTGTPGESNAEPVVAAVDHYLITHVSTNLSCKNTSVNIKACEDAACTSVLDGVVAGNLNYNTGGTDTVITAFSFSNGEGDVEFSHTTPETITLTLSDSSPSAGYKCTDGTDDTCEIIFSTFGYDVTVNDITSSTSTNSLNNEVSVQALEAVENNPAVCEAAVVGDQNVYIDFSYIDHDVGYDEEPLLISLDGTDNSYSTTKTRTLDFSVNNATASFYIRYGDAGKLRLSVSDPNGTVVTGYDDFSVIPNNLTLTMDDGINNLGATGNELHYAGQSFNLSIQAVNVEGGITENYRPGNLQLQAIMTAPLTDNGANLVDFKYGGDSSLSIGNTGVWSVTDNLSFSNSGFTASAAQFGNVGEFTVNVKDSNYLTYEIETVDSNAVDAGRFIPAYFTFESVPSTSIENSHTTFTYIGEVLDFDSIPTFNYVAKTYTNETATNYVFVESQFAFINRLYVEDTSYSVFDYPVPSVINSADLGDGIFEFSLDGGFTYEKPVSPVDEFESTIDLTLTTSDLQDSDGVGYDVDGINNDTPVYTNYQAMTNTFKLFYGRLFVDNAFGAEDTDLWINAKVQYWNGETYALNTEDSSTDFSAITAEIRNEDGDLLGTLTPEVDTTSLFNAGIIELPNGYKVEATGSVGTLYFNFMAVPEYLNVNWNVETNDNDDSDEVIDNTEDYPTSTVIFGTYRGNDRIIYKRER